MRKVTDMRFYNSNAGRNQMAGAATDRHGNAQGSQYDLATDGAFRGQSIVVLQLYNFEFGPVGHALREKGFSLLHWRHPPSPGDMRAALSKACQFWLISNSTPLLAAAHLDVIAAFYEAGNGLYLWGDNDPYHADTNRLSQRLFGTTMAGDTPGCQTVGLRKGGKGPGLLGGHLLTTGLQHLYEGASVASIDRPKALTPLLYGSAGNLISAFRDSGGKRAILDGGFTRLYVAWDESGTARYVKNAAAWLANVERRPQEPPPVRQPEAIPALVATISAQSADVPSGAENLDTFQGMKGLG